jgi:hypothetical protein
MGIGGLCACVRAPVCVCVCVCVEVFLRACFSVRNVGYVQRGTNVSPPIQLNTTVFCDTSGISEHINVTITV